MLRSLARGLLSVLVVVAALIVIGLTDMWLWRFAQ
jgi:hypothetical protein